MERTAPKVMNGIRGSRRESVNKRGDVLHNSWTMAWLLGGVSGERI